MKQNTVQISLQSLWAVVVRWNTRKYHVDLCGFQKRPAVMQMLKHFWLRFIQPKCFWLRINHFYLSLYFFFTNTHSTAAWILKIPQPTDEHTHSSKYGARSKPSLLFEMSFFFVCHNPCNMNSNSLRLKNASWLSHRACFFCSNWQKV